MSVSCASFIVACFVVFLGCFVGGVSHILCTIICPSSRFFFCLFSALLYITLRDGNLWLGDENLAGGEAKEICLVIPCCPLSIEWAWANYAQLHFPLYKTETLEMYAMLEKKKHIPFSQEILLMYFYELCNKMQVNVFGVFMKITCFFSLCVLTPC